MVTTKGYSRDTKARQDVKVMVECHKSLILEETLSKKILEEEVNHTTKNTLILAYWWIDVSIDVGFIYIGVEQLYHKYAYVQP